MLTFVRLLIITIVLMCLGVVAAKAFMTNDWILLLLMVVLASAVLTFADKRP